MLMATFNRKGMNLSMNNFYSFLFKLISAIAIVSLLIFCISGVYTYQTIDKLAYVIALAIDKGSNNNLKLTIQLANPSSDSSGSSSSSSSTQSSSSAIDSVECSSISSGLDLFNSYISRNINMSHCKVVVISEELASMDITNEIYDLSNNVEVSSHANVIVSKCRAGDFLEMSHPVLEKFSARYYQMAPASSQYTGYTEVVPLIDFFSAYLDSFKQPTAILGNINVDSTHSSSVNGLFVNGDSTYVAGQTPITSKNHIENMGIAVFKGGQLVGELNGFQTICHEIVSGNLKSCNIQVENPEKGKRNIDISISLTRKPACKIYFVNNYPYIISNIKLNVRILSVDKGSNYLEEATVAKLENQITEYMQNELTSYLYTMSKVYNSDIDGFGKYAVAQFPTIESWNNYDWLNNFQNSFFKVNLKVNIKSGYDFLST